MEFHVARFVHGGGGHTFRWPLWSPVKWQILNSAKFIQLVFVDARMHAMADSDSGQPNRAAALEKIAATTNHPPEAFQFVLSLVRQLDQHVDGGHLCWLLRNWALRCYGSDARDQLREWNIGCCEDFGHIVYTLVYYGLIGKADSDSIDDFNNVYDFETQFAEPADTRSRDKPFQFGIATLFVVVTVAAIASALLAQVGFAGAVTTLFMAWLALIGVFCLYQGVTDPTCARVPAVLSGVIILAIAILVLWAILFAPPVPP